MSSGRVCRQWAVDSSTQRARVLISQIAALLDPRGDARAKRRQSAQRRDRNSHGQTGAPAEARHVVHADAAAGSGERLGAIRLAAPQNRPRWPPKTNSAASRVGSLGPLSTQYALATIKLSALVENLPSKQPGSDATAYLTCYLRLLPDVDMKNSSTVDGVCANSSKVDCARAYIPTHDLDKATRQELESYRTDGAEPYHPAPLSNSGGYGKCRNI